MAHNYYSSKGKQDYATPRWLYRGLNREFPFLLDAAASPENTKCARFYTTRDNGLRLPWALWTFCNPPFRRIRPWVEKAIDEAFAGHNSVLLLPAACSTRWFRDHYRWANTRLLFPRVVYERAPPEVPFGSMVMIFTEQSVNDTSDNTITLLDVSNWIGIQ